MIHHKDLYMLATIRHHVESIRHPSAFHFDVITIHPVNIRNLLLAPVTAIGKLFQSLLAHTMMYSGWYFSITSKKALPALVILFGCASLARTTHRHLQIVEEVLMLI